MDVLRDQSWMRDLYTSSPAERFERGRFSVAIIASKPNAARHNERYRYRMFFFENGGVKPVLAVNMESDLLGTWRLTVMTAAGSRIVASFDEPPGYESFKTAGFAIADEEAAQCGPGSSKAEGAKRRGRGSPAGHAP